ncbi:F-box protein CPR1 [Linum grandiflorum]
MNAKGKHGCRPPQSHRSSRVWKKPSFMNKIISFLKNETTTSSASTGNDGFPCLPDDIVLHILVKLPAKTLLRFKCLSTSIRNLIQSPYFVAAHTEHQRTNHACIAFLGYSAREFRTSPDNVTHSVVSSLSFPFLNNPNIEHPKLEYVGSWNGLVCLNIFKNSTSTSINPLNMVLWNPTTSEFSFAPLPLIIPFDDDRLVYGFGYDSVSDNYKSVRIVNPTSPGSPPEAEVLSWGQRSWTKLAHEPVQSCLYGRISGIQPDPMTSKGRVIWLVSTTTPSAMLLSFELGQEKFEWISPPPTDYDGPHTYWVRIKCVWKGSLAMLETKDSRTNLWLFNDVDDDEGRDRSCCWSKLFTVQPDSLPGWMSKPEDIWRIPGDACISFLVYRYDDRLALASIIREFNSGKHDHLIHTRSVFEFEKTLVSVPGSNSDS